MQLTNSLQNKLSLIPHKPGVYLYKDQQSNIIYIGKAKNLAKRTAQYFNGQWKNYRIADLVKNISDVETIITKSEIEALILEQNLIKKHNPYYNVLMRDDKQYPYICVTNEKYPRFQYLRKYTPKKGKFYGPFPDGTYAREILFLLNRIFQLRKCDVLPKKECLYFHLGQCAAPCVNKIEDSFYTNIKKEVDQFFKGNNHTIINDLTKKMEQEAANEKFEAAHEIKNIINKLKAAQDPQLVEFMNKDDIDFVGFHEMNDYLAICILFYRGGKLLTTEIEVMPTFGDYETELTSYLKKFYETNIVPDTVYLNNKTIKEVLNASFTDKVFAIAEKGKKSEVISLANENAKKNLETKITTLTRQFSQNEELKTYLYETFKKPIATIDMIDASHIQTDNYVSVVIALENFKFNFKNYRKFNLQKWNVLNDYDAMRMTVAKRYENIEVLPDVLIVDGGEKQVNAAYQVAKVIAPNLLIAGLKKNDKHQTHSLIINDQEILLKSMPKNAALFFTKIQNEVHRFAISTFRKKASKSLFRNEFEKYEYLNEHDVTKLLASFSDINKIKQATLDELSSVISKSKAKKLYDQFR